MPPSCFFSPKVYGPTASTALNALVRTLETQDQPCNPSLYHTFIKPEGSAFEADMLMSCTGFDESPIGRVVNSAISRDVMPGGAGGDAEELLSAFGNPILLRTATGFHCPSLVDTVMEIRANLPKTTVTRQPRRGQAFKDALFGPQIARVLNALHAFEVWVASGSRAIKFTHSDMFSNQTFRRPYALCTEEGTAYAADVLTLQHNFPLLGLTRFLFEAKPGADFGLKDALFPAFCNPLVSGDPERYYIDFAESLTAAMRNLRIAMFSVSQQGMLVHVGHSLSVHWAEYHTETDEEFMRLIAGMDEV
jgi:hypothetical protein